MKSTEKLEFNLKLNTPEGVTLRKLEELRLSLFSQIKSVFTEYELDIYQEPTSRSLDPTIVGAIALAISPILIEKLVDTLIFWAEQKQDNPSITLTVPIKGAEPLEITFNPKTTNPDNVKKWIESAIKAVKAGTNR